MLDKQLLRAENAKLPAAHTTGSFTRREHTFPF